MSLATKLRPHVEELKVHKKITDLSPTERRLNQMTAVILNKTMSKATKDKILRKIVSESQVEKALKQRGITVSLHSSPEVRIQRHDHR
jgi:ribosomal protein L19